MKKSSAEMLAEAMSPKPKAKPKMKNVPMINEGESMDDAEEISEITEKKKFGGLLSGKGVSIIIALGGKKK